MVFRLNKIEGSAVRLVSITERPSPTVERQERATIDFGNVQEGQKSYRTMQEIRDSADAQADTEAMIDANREDQAWGDALYVNKLAGAAVGALIGVVAALTLIPTSIVFAWGVWGAIALTTLSVLVPAALGWFLLSPLISILMYATIFFGSKERTEQDRQ